MCAHVSNAGTHGRHAAGHHPSVRPAATYPRPRGTRHAASRHCCTHSPDTRSIARTMCRRLCGPEARRAASGRVGPQVELAHLYSPPSARASRRACPGSSPRCPAGLSMSALCLPRSRPCSQETEGVNSVRTHGRGGKQRTRTTRWVYMYNTDRQIFLVIETTVCLSVCLSGCLSVCTTRWVISIQNKDTLLVFGSIMQSGQGRPEV